MRAPRVHHAARRRGGGVAARGARAAGGRSCRPSDSWLRARLRSESQWVAAFVQRLRELGWIEGRTVAIEYRWAEGRNERFAEIAAEFVRLKVDVIVTVGNPAHPRGKAGDIGHPDRVRGGGGPGRRPAWSRVLARPGGNVTGLSNCSKPILPASDLNCCARLFPVCAGWRSWPMCGNPAAVLEMGEAQATARTLGLEVDHIGNPASGGHRARLRRAQGPRGCTLCLCRPAREHQPDSHQHLGAGRATADDVRVFGSTSKREV